MFWHRQDDDLIQKIKSSVILKNIFTIFRYFSSCFLCFYFYICFLPNWGQLYVCEGFSGVNVARLPSPLRQSSTKMCSKWKWRFLTNLEDRRSFWVICVAWFNQLKGPRSRLSKERDWKTQPVNNSINPRAPLCTPSWQPALWISDL